MKKIILRILFLLAGLTAMAQARFFIGLDGQYDNLVSYQPDDLKVSTTSFNIIPTTSIILSLGDTNGGSGGVNFGVESDFSRYFVLRTTLAGGYGAQTSQGLFSKINSSFLYLNLSADVLLNFFNTGSSSFGIYGGVSAGYLYSMMKITPILLLSDGNSFRINNHNIAFFGRIGFSAMFADHHRIEVGASIPFANIYAVGSELTQPIINGYSNLSLGASYKYIF